MVAAGHGGDCGQKTTLFDQLDSRLVESSIRIGEMVNRVAQPSLETAFGLVDLKLLQLW